MYYVTCGVESPCFRMLPQVWCDAPLGDGVFRKQTLLYFPHSLTRTLKISKYFSFAVGEQLPSHHHHRPHDPGICSLHISVWRPQLGQGAYHWIQCCQSVL